jgi:hypothetical protein
MDFKSKTRFGTIIALLFLMLSCQSGEKKNAKLSPAADTLQTAKKPPGISKDTVRESAEVSAFFESFKALVKSHQKDKIAKVVYFPLQTLPIWSNDELKSAPIDFKAGLVEKSEFNTYYKDLFSQDAVKQIALASMNDISRVADDIADDYFKQLKKLADENTSLFELFIQYAPSNGNETSFGFVFGKVNGKYKALSYFSPWPVKG